MVLRDRGRTGGTGTGDETSNSEEHVAWKRATCKVGKLPAQPLNISDRVISVSVEAKQKKKPYAAGHGNSEYNAINMFLF